MKNINLSELQEIVNQANSKADICRALGIAPKGGNYAIIDKLLTQNGIVWDKSYVPWNKGKCYKNKHRSLSEILVKDSPHKSTFKLKLRLIKEGIKQHACECCGYTDTAELHHINGNPTDNRLENLQILCPNCHSKTSNYRMKNSSIGRVIQDPSILYLTQDEIEQREIERKAKKCGKTVEQYLKDKLEQKNKQTKVCVVCGTHFIRKDLTQKYCSRECYIQENKGKRPEFLQLLNDFKNLKSFVQVGIKYGVSDNAVRKWCKLYNIPTHSKDLKQYVEKMV